MTAAKRSSAPASARSPPGETLLVTAAGYAGTVAKSGKTFARGQYSVHASGKGGKLRVRIVGYCDGCGRLPLDVEVDVPATPATERPAEISKIAKRVRAILAGIDADDAAAPVAEPPSLPEALQALLDRLATKLRQPRVTRVVASGRTFSLTLAGQKRPVTSDRSTLLTLVRDLWGPRVFKRGIAPRWALHEEETILYVSLLARASKEDARALYVHLYSPYRIYFDRGHRLAKLFPEPLWASKHLDRGASANHLIERALPDAERGALVERIAALSVIDDTLGRASSSDRHAAEIRLGLERLVASLARERAPLLREAGWLVDASLKKSDL